MSIDRIHGRVVFLCDDCGDDLETDETDFESARAELRPNGWRTVKSGRDWNHYCCASCEAEGEDASGFEVLD